MLPTLEVDTDTVSDVAVMNDDDGNWDYWEKGKEDELDDDELGTQEYIVNWLATGHNRDGQTEKLAGWIWE